jgi:bacteriocin-like protein
LSQIVAGVAKTSIKSLHNFCPSPQIAIPLPTQTSNNACHCKTRSLTIKIYKIMKQNEKNIQKDQELTKEELENVNGGGKHLNIRRGHGV